MKNFITKIVHLLIAYFIYGFGIALTVNANLGLAPWGVFHQGLSMQTGITLGRAIQIVGAAILILDLVFNERIGWGTLANIYFIGLFYDLIQSTGLIPVYDNFVPQLLMMAVGMVITSFSTFLYLSARMGTGPRDGLMVALTKRINLPVGVIRTAIELTALVIGYFMGGTVGWGTLIMSFGIGFFIQVFFTLFKFDVRQVEHRYIDQDIVDVVEFIKSKKLSEKEE